MKTISKAELKKAILAVEAERLKHPAKFRPDRAQLATLQKSRQASDKMLSGFLRQAGVDLKGFQALQQKRSAELARMVAAHKARSLARAAQHKDTLTSSIVAQSTMLRDLASSSGFFPHPSFSLDTPFLIWTIPLADIAASAAVPFGSWAKFKFSTSDYVGSQKVGFYFSWVNHFKDYAVIDAATYLAATGYLTAHAPWDIATKAAEVQATSLFNLWLGWPDAVVSTNNASEFLGITGAYASFGTGGDTEGISISSGGLLNTTLFAVPPGAVTVFEVALDLDYQCDGGDITADFASGDFRIACPVVVVSLLNSPPGKVSTLPRSAT